MSTKSEKVKSDESLVDDVSDENIEVSDDDLEQQKMEKLKAKLKAKEDSEKKTEEGTVPPKIVEPKKQSIRFGIIGSGQGGSRLAEVFYKLGYDSIAVNTASQDLQGIEMPDSNKLLLSYGLGGAGKELDIGYEAAEAHRAAINELVYNKLNDAELLVFCTSLGGGSGAGSAEVIVDILSKLDRPVCVITILPMSTDDPQTKDNAIKTLTKFTNMVNSSAIDNLIVVDNARIETIYSDVGPLNFFNVSNKAIVEPIDKFNTLSHMASSVKPLDPTEFGKLFTDGRGLTIYGMMKVYDFEEDTAIAEAVVENMSGSLLASGFDLKQARYAGAIFTAPRRVWDKIPNASVNYAKSMVNDVCGNPIGTFHGIYEVDDDEDCVRVYSMFSGLGLPDDRIKQLREDAKERMAQAAEKDEHRKLTLKIDAQEETVSAADAIKKKIERKKSKFGKLHSRAVQDRRKK